MKSLFFIDKRYQIRIIRIFPISNLTEFVDKARCYRYDKYDKSITFIVQGADTYMILYPLKREVRCIPARSRHCKC